LHAEGHIARNACAKRKKDQSIEVTSFRSEGEYPARMKRAIGRKSFCTKSRSGYFALAAAGRPVKRPPQNRPEQAAETFAAGVRGRKSF
jgi:hypothetical protein